MSDLIEELQELSGNGTPLTLRPLKNPHNKWIVRSAFQKAIRRGNVEEALRMAEYMLHRDPVYSWVSLAIIIVEDIGFGDADLLSYSTMTTLKSVRDEVEPELLFSAMVQRACVSLKSRSCCELALGADLELTDQKTWNSKQSPEFLLSEMMRWLNSTVVTDCVLKLPRAYTIAKILRKSIRGTGADELNLVLTKIMESEIGFSEKRASMLSFERTVDDMNLALFPILHFGMPWHGLEEVKSTLVVPEETKIMGVSSSAFDAHTAHGNRALKLLWEAMKDKWEWGEKIDPEIAHKAIGAALFIVEGALVTRRVASADLDNLRDYQDTQYAMSKGLFLPEDAENRFAIFNDVLEAIPMLNEFRLKVANNKQFG